MGPPQKYLLYFPKDFQPHQLCLTQLKNHHNYAVEFLWVLPEISKEFSFVRQTTGPAKSQTGRTKNRNEYAGTVFDNAPSLSKMEKSAEPRFSGKVRRRIGKIGVCSEIDLLHIHKKRVCTTGV